MNQNYNFCTMLHKLLKLTLCISHHKNRVHDSKFQEIIGCHPVDHNHERPRQFETTVSQKLIKPKSHCSKSSSKDSTLISRKKCRFFLG